MQKRQAEAAGNLYHVARATAPYFPNIQNTTCLTAPEVTEGPYYVNDEFVRQDIRETQEGVKLLMDFGVIDTTTCTPMNNSFVEIWHANALGEYGAYHTGTFNGQESWLRGGWYTDTNGMMEVTTIYPGHYTGRAPHIHIMVHKDWSQTDNGTLISDSGTMLHIGQAFFDESWNDRVYDSSPYTSNGGRRTLNSQDSIFAQSFRNGYSPYANLQYLSGDDLSGGLVGYLTLGVDSRSSYTINNDNHNGNTVGSTNSNSNGNANNNSNGGSNASAASPRAWGWGSAFYLPALMLAFLGYRYTPNPLRG